MTIRALARKVPAYLQIGLAHDFKKDWLHPDFYNKAKEGWRIFHEEGTILVFVEHQQQTRKLELDSDDQESLSVFSSIIPLLCKNKTTT